MSHLRSKTPLTASDCLRGRPTWIQRGLGSNKFAIPPSRTDPLSPSPSPPPASFPCHRPSSIPSLLRRRGRRAARPQAQGAARSWPRTQRRACKRTAAARSCGNGGRRTRRRGYRWPTGTTVPCFRLAAASASHGMAARSAPSRPCSAPGGLLLGSGPPHLRGLPAPRTPPRRCSSWPPPERRRRLGGRRRGWGGRERGSVWEGGIANLLDTSPRWIRVGRPRRRSEAVLGVFDLK